ncbi:MAG: hypothetical protein IJW18_01500 [Lachnospiraceae bacterium]|nr:hypothetical protein [Lachnospiraceae bacterium]
MKKILWYVSGLIIIFIAVVGIMLFNKHKKPKENQPAVEMLMGDATLPMVHFWCGDVQMNTLHGYVDDIDIMSTRDTITPLGEERKLRLSIDTYGTKVTGISYEIRSLDMTRVLEKTSVEAYEEADEVIDVTFNIDNLMNVGEDYHLIIILSLEDGRTANYYTRLIMGIDNAAEKVAYVSDFHERTFDKDAALELVRYLESGSKGDNTNYGKVNIYSSFNQITWGNLDVERIGKPQISLKEINGNISYFTVDYMVSFSNMYGTKETYKVKEYYRTKFTSTRTYLLDFERTMEQYFEPVSENMYTNNINVGITADLDAAIHDVLEDTSGQRVCFVRNGELWEYYAKEHRLIRIFSFRDEEMDVRCALQEHDIRIAKIDDEGNVTFIVYGYMNRGQHEGCVGMSVFKYIEAENRIEEVMYIPYDQSFDMLQGTVGEICYLNPSNWLYFVMDEKLYSVDLTSKEYVVVLEGLKKGNYVTNKAGNTLVWKQNAGDSTQELTIMDLEANSEKHIKCGADDVVELFDYMDEDIVYGVARKADAVQQINGTQQYYFYKICIIDGDATQVGIYEKENIYIKDITISDRMITLDRYQKDETGEFKPIEVDYLTRNTSTGNEILGIRNVATELKKKEAVLTISATVKESKPEVIKVSNVHFTGEEFAFDVKENSEAGYYVYAKGEYLGSYVDLPKAIETADANMGIVVDDEWRYIWKRGNTYSSINLSDISVQVNEDNTMVACIDAMLKKAGVVTISASLFKEGKNVEEIITATGELKYLSFAGLSLDKIFYSINEGRPVVGKLSADEYVLITGYDSKNITLYSALTGTRSKLSITDATKKFEEQGNIFFGYID